MSINRDVDSTFERQGVFTLVSDTSVATTWDR